MPCSVTAHLFTPTLQCLMQTKVCLMRAQTYSKLLPVFCLQIHLLLGHSIYKARSAPCSSFPNTISAKPIWNRLVVSPGEQPAEKCSSHVCSQLPYRWRGSASARRSVSSPVPKCHSTCNGADSHFCQKWSWSAAGCVRELWKDLLAP